MGKRIFVSLTVVVLSVPKRRGEISVQIHMEFMSSLHPSSFLQPSKLFLTILSAVERNHFLPF